MELQPITDFKPPIEIFPTDIPQVRRRVSWKSVVYVGVLLVVVISIAVAIGIQLGSRQLPNQQRSTTAVTTLNQVEENIIVNDASSITNWKTYSNIAYNLQFTYPENWEIKENVSLQNIALVTVTISAPSGNSLFDVWVRNGTWEEAKNDLSLGNTPVTVNGIDGYVQPAATGKIFILPSNNTTQIIQIVYGSTRDSSPEEIAILDQMLSTFSYID